MACCAAFEKYRYFWVLLVFASFVPFFCVCLGQQHRKDNSTESVLFYVSADAHDILSHSLPLSPAV
jgi:hypothetical protein